MLSQPGKHIVSLSVVPVRDASQGRSHVQATGRNAGRVPASMHGLGAMPCRSR